MKFNKVVNIDVCNAVTVGQHERLVAYIFLNSLNSAACHCVKTRIN